MSFELLSWVFVILSLAGNIYVIQKNVLGQWLWTFSNVGWIFFDLYIGAYSQAALFAAYLVMSIWGVISWTKEAKKAEAQSNS